MTTFKKVFSCESIYESVKPFHKTSKLFGLTCFDFDLKTKRAYFDLVNILFILAWIFIWIAISISSFRDLSYEELNYSNRGNIIGILYRVMLIANPVIMVCIIILCNYKRKNVSRFLKKIYIFDETLKELGCKAQPSNNNFYFLFICFFGLMMIGIKCYFVSKFGILEGFRFHYLGAVFDSPVIIIMWFHLILSSYSVLTRMKNLGVNFKRLEIQQHRDQLFVRTTIREKVLLKCISKLYVTLLDAIDELNSAFTVEVMGFKF